MLSKGKYFQKRNADFSDTKSSRITVWLKLEGTPREHLVQRHYSSTTIKSHLPRTMSRQLLNTWKEGNSTIYLSNLCSAWSPSQWKRVCWCLEGTSHVSALSLVLSLGTTAKWLNTAALCMFLFVSAMQWEGLTRRAKVQDTQGLWSCLTTILCIKPVMAKTFICEGSWSQGPGMGSMALRRERIVLQITGRLSTFVVQRVNFHRIIEWLGLVGTLKIILLQPPPPWAGTLSTRPDYSKPDPIWPLTGNSDRYGTSTTSLWLSIISLMSTKLKVHGCSRKVTCCLEKTGMRKTAMLLSKLSSVLRSLRHIDSANVIPRAGVVDFWNLFQLLSQKKALPLKLQLQAWLFLRRQVRCFQPSSKTDVL